MSDEQSALVALVLIAGRSNPDRERHCRMDEQGSSSMKKMVLMAVVALACIHPFDWNKRIFPRGMDQVSVWAVPVKFQWNASTGAVAGYRLHQGTTSGTYTSSQDVPGTGTMGTMEMDPDASRYVAATAYDSAKRESAFSNEILCHPVVVSSTAGGTISPSETFFVQDGRSVTFTVTPDHGGCDI